MVMTTSEVRTASAVSVFGCSAAMSMPTSCMACTATGLIRSAGREPAERTSMRSPASSRRNPAAICERPALCTQTKRTDDLMPVMISPDRGSGHGDGSRADLQHRGGPAAPAAALGVESAGTAADSGGREDELIALGRLVVAGEVGDDAAHLLVSGQGQERGRAAV